MKTSILVVALSLLLSPLANAVPIADADLDADGDLETFAEARGEEVVTPGVLKMLVSPASTNSHHILRPHPPLSLSTPHRRPPAHPSRFTTTVDR
jgi:hypothetical protein